MTRAGRSNYKPFWGRCQFPRSTRTHCCVLLGGEADILEAKLSVPKWEAFRTGAEGPGSLGRRLSDTHTPRNRRGNGEFLFAHLKCAPVRRALSATDSVCSLLQDGGSTPIHFLLIASQLSLSTRLGAHRFPAEPSGTSPSISSLTNGAKGRGLGFVSLCFPPATSSGGCGAFNGGCSDHRRGAPCVGLRTTFFPQQKMFPARL